MEAQQVGQTLFIYLFIYPSTLRFFYFSTSHVMISSIFTNFFLVSEENVVITLQKAHCNSTLSLRKRHYVHLFLLFQLTE